MITALCGGVGGSKLALGLHRSLPADDLAIIVNTADDLEFCGLHVSPDLDTVVYTLAGLAVPPAGWGIGGDTFHALEMLGRFGTPTWFKVGDRDLATNLYRTQAMGLGRRLTEITAHIASSLGVRARILPMTDDPVNTRLLVDGEWIHFQDYFVRLGHRSPVDAIVYEGIESAGLTGRVRGALMSAEAIVLVNSNPVLSILPILAVPGLNELLISTDAPKVAVSPIVGDDAVSGPAGVLMRLIGQPASALGVAQAYTGIVDGIVIDRRDAQQVKAIEALGVRVLCTDIVMHDDADRERLATEAIAFARGLR
jgi:LPPG:FO 2-phospho-L-lactate transferase